jgi:hypothetical protein
VGSRLLVPYQYVTQVGANKSIVNRKISPARESKDYVHPFLFKGVDQRFSARHFNQVYCSPIYHSHKRLLAEQGLL